MVHKLPELPYALDALDPWIDERTMKVHYGKHHQAYVDKLNETLKGHEQLLNMPAESMLKDLTQVPEQIRQKVINFGGGVANHTFFWHSLKKEGGMPKGAVLQAIERDFGSFGVFKEKFAVAANSLFGSGWAWLVLDQGKVQIMQTMNQDSPLSIGIKPLLTLDVWEHAYYLQFQNRRADWVTQFFDFINWDVVEKRFSE